ncbi:MAG: serine/threonine-protein kinase [Planctomycetota bacterium]|nr:serine/threonine-protein kinase [Planctomycetota bacterium]
MSQIIGGFQLVRKVAESHSAEIFLAIRLAGKGRGGEYALKALRPQFAHDPLYRGYLETEYRVCSGLEHPNLVRILELELNDVRPHLIMDFIPGRSLQMLLRRGRPSLLQSLAWLGQAADGLAYFHELGYLHRDVKPQNIIAADESPVRVIDFALARRQDATPLRHMMRKWFERRRPGTWSYMSPEQIQNDRLTGQSDVYSLGVTLYECLTGRVPFASHRPQDLLDQHVRAPVPTVRSLDPDVPLQVDDFVQAMLAKDPLDRPQGMGYVSAMLRALAEAYGRKG